MTGGIVWVSAGLCGHMHKVCLFPGGPLKITVEQLREIPVRSHLSSGRSVSSQQLQAVLSRDCNRTFLAFHFLQHIFNWWQPSQTHQPLFLGQTKTCRSSWNFISLPRFNGKSIKLPLWESYLWISSNQTPLSFDPSHRSSPLHWSKPL